MLKKLVIAEKKSVADDISKALGLKGPAGDGFRENESYIVSWAVGHLLELMDPEDLDKKYKAWLLKDLPILPDLFEYKVVSRTKDQYQVLKKLLKRKDIECVINACDAGREGELIFRAILEKEKCKLPVLRLWLSSMTKEAIQKGFLEGLMPGAQFEGLAAAAKSRSESDWLIGINGTRAVTKRLNSRTNRTVFSVGRVQTPTLKMVVDRELEIITHVPRPYARIEAQFQAKDHKYGSVLQSSQNEENRERFFDLNQAREIQKRLGKPGLKAKASETRKSTLQKPYPLYDLTSLQRDANTRFGMSAARTLSAAQRLYEREKALTYPRTDSRHLPQDYQPFLENVFASLSSHPEYGVFARRLRGKAKASDRKIFDDSKVSDHFAIIPTGELPKNLEGDDARVYDLVVKRTMAILFPPAEYEVVDRVTVLDDLTFRSKGKFLKVMGWVEIYGKLIASEDEVSLPPLSGPLVELMGSELSEHMTKPPGRIGEARLLTLMETAGKELDDEELFEAMGGKGIGTPATRADIIENLIQKEYLVRMSGGALKATGKAIRLMDVLSRVNVKRLHSVELTAEMEHSLKELESGKVTRAAFMKEIVGYVKEVVDQVRDFDYETLYQGTEPVAVCPKCGSKVFENLFGYACQHNTQKEATCDFMVLKEYSGKYFHPAQVSQFIKNRETEEEKLQYMDGREFYGKLILDADCKVQVLSKNAEGEYVSTRSKSVQEMAQSETFSEEKSVESLFFEQVGMFRHSSAAYYFEVARFPKSLGKKTPKTQEPFVSRLPATVCDRPIQESEALEFFQKGKTGLLSNFISKKGKPFNATLYIKADGKHGFEFEPRVKKSKSSEEATA
ncbi:MAG: topoisomerase C-terminal repeat-containing protein [Candidatus Cloacimonetes bacterium]|nr:topoisomerase C-terminal repeat-containing protein [Candidatus Cloacimonadota bacterium]